MLFNAPQTGMTAFAVFPVLDRLEYDHSGRAGGAPDKSTAWTFEVQVVQVNRWTGSVRIPRVPGSVGNPPVRFVWI